MPAILQRKEKGNDMAIILKRSLVGEPLDPEELYEKYKRQLDNGLMILDHDVKFVHESTEAHEIEIIREETTDAADLQRELHTIRMRLQHLLQSDFIRSFDEKDIKTGEYVRDIKHADLLVKPAAAASIVAVPIEKSNKLFRWL